MRQNRSVGGDRMEESKVRNERGKKRKGEGKKWVKLID
jgi:hypothetical protein